MTFAAPIPEVLDRTDKWARPFLKAVTFTARLPPPPPGAVPSPRPAPAMGGQHPHVDHGRPSRGARGVVGREVVDAFELIWPTGEVDEQFLGGPLSEMPAPGAPYSDAPRSDDPGPAPMPMTVRLKPLTTPPAVPEPAWSEPVSDDVVLAIQRAIAAIGSEPVVVGEPPLASDLPELNAEPVAGVPGASALDATDDDGITALAVSEPGDARRSALQRLIGGLRRR